MPEYDNTNRFTLWGNKDKTADTPTWADFQGEINIDGKEYWLSCWKRKPDGNPKAPPLSGTVKLKEARTAPAPLGERDTTSGIAENPGGGGFDDIPFAPVNSKLP